MKESWTQLLGKYQGNEIVAGDMISRPCNSWGSVDSNNTKFYTVLYRAENNLKALEIFNVWKSECVQEYDNGQT